MQLAGRHGAQVDLDRNGKALGVEITTPSSLTVKQVNAVLSEHGIDRLDAAESAPLATLPRRMVPIGLAARRAV